MNSYTSIKVMHINLLTDLCHSEGAYIAIEHPGQAHLPCLGAIADNITSQTHPQLCWLSCSVMTQARDQHGTIRLHTHTIHPALPHPSTFISNTTNNNRGCGNNNTTSSYLLVTALNLPSDNHGIAKRIPSASNGGVKRGMKTEAGAQRLS